MEPLLGLTGIFRWLNDAAHVVTSVGAALLVVAAAALLAVALVQGRRLARTPLVVITTLLDATGDQVAGKAAAGITHRLREQLVVSLPQLSKRAKELIDDARQQRNSPIERLFLHVGGPEVLLDEIDKSAQALSESVSAVAPDAVRPALQVLTRALLRPKGVQAAGLLQRRSDAAGHVAISFTLSDLRSPGRARRVTVWEGEDTDVTGMELLERLHALVVPAAGVLACELVRQRLRLSPPVATAPRAFLARRAAPAPVDDALVASFVGIMYQVQARRMKPATTSFYRLSAAELQAALSIGHYRVAEALADSLAEQARRTRSEPRAENLFREAVGRYAEASQSIARSGVAPDRLPVEQFRINASRGIAHALLAEKYGSADANLADQATAALGALRGVDPATITDATALYSASCAWAVAARAGLPVEGADIHAKRFLMHSWLRDKPVQGWYGEMQYDPDLSTLQGWSPSAHQQLMDALPEERAAMTPEAAAQLVDRLCPPASPAPRPPRARRASKA